MQTIDPQAMGDRIRRMREACNMSQTRFALLVGETVTQSLVSRWENGMQIPGTTHLAGIVQALGVSADFLLFGNEGSYQRLKKIDTSA